MEQKIKILLCGDVEGRFDTLFTRVENIIAKSGPLDLMLCVGNFFGINNKEIISYKDGSKKVPVPTYILGPNKEESLELYSESDAEICPNIYYLGKRGVYRSIGGLRIAYLSGVAADRTTSEKVSFTVEDVKFLRDVCIKGNDNYRGVDILMTSQWPAGISNNDSNFKANLTVNAGSDCISWLATQIKPRYHVSGLEGIYYERRPYRTLDATDEDSSMAIATRFVGLARVGDAKKGKWIHALSLKPIDKMNIRELLQKTTDETPCPYRIGDLDARVLNKKRAQARQQYFYDMNSPSGAEVKSKKFKKQKIEYDQSKCWFCLASPTVEKHLIITVGSSVYLTLAKGGLVEEHFLICPIEHYKCSLGQSAAISEEVLKFKEAVTKFYGRRDNVPVFFERNYKSSHMQIQCVPVPKGAQKELSDIFKEEAEGNDFRLEELDSHNRLEQVVSKGALYFTVELPAGSVLYTKIDGSKGFPLNFGREVLAAGPILNMPGRVEWKDCVLKREDEEELVKRIRGDFASYDITE